MHVYDRPYVIQCGLLPITERPADSYASTPNPTTRNTINCDIKARVTPNDWNTNNTIVQQGYDDEDDRAFFFGIVKTVGTNAPQLWFKYTNNGETDRVRLSAGIPSPSGTMWVRVFSEDLPGASMRHTFYYSLDTTNDADSVSWTQINTVTTTLLLPELWDSSADITVGGIPFVTRFEGTIHAVKVSDFVGTIIDVEFTSGASSGVWTLHGDASYSNGLVLPAVPIADLDYHSLTCPTGDGRTDDAEPWIEALWQIANSSGFNGNWFDPAETHDWFLHYGTQYTGTGTGFILNIDDVPHSGSTLDSGASGDGPDDPSVVGIDHLGNPAEVAGPADGPPLFGATVVVPSGQDFEDNPAAWATDVGESTRRPDTAGMVGPIEGSGLTVEWADYWYDNNSSAGIGWKWPSISGDVPAGLARGEATAETNLGKLHTKDDSNKR